MPAPTALLKRRADRQVAELYRKLCLVLGIACAVLVLLLLVVSRRSVVPYLVHVDRHGSAVGVGEALQAATPPEDWAVREYLMDWVWRIRSVSSDKAIQRTFVDSAAQQVGGQAIEVVERFLNTRNPMDPLTPRVVVQVEVALLEERERGRWRVEWVEREFRVGGAGHSETSWVAAMRVKFEPGRTTAEVLDRPLGLTIVGVEWTARKAEV